MSHHPTIARRADAVLVVIDIQERLSQVMERRASVLAATEKLIQTAALLGVPIVATRQYPVGLGDLEPAIIAAIDEAETVTPVLRADKTTFDCFAEPAFADALASTGRRQLVIAGMESHICVTQTALSGVQLGFDVHVVADACCSRVAEANDLALERMRASGVVITATESVLYELVGAAATDEFRALLRVVKG